MATQTVSAPPTGEAGVKAQFDRELEERLVRYARIDTQSDERSTTSPEHREAVRPAQAAGGRAEVASARRTFG